MNEMLQALQRKQVDAVVFTSLVLLYYAAHEGKGLVKLVGPEFNVSPIAFGFQLESPCEGKFTALSSRCAKTAPISNSTTSGSVARNQNSLVS
jgi:hypothetical protein